MNAPHLLRSASTALAAIFGVLGCKAATTSQPLTSPVAAEHAPEQTDKPSLPANARIALPPRRTMTSQPFCTLKDGNSIVCIGGGLRHASPHVLPEPAKGQRIVDIAAGHRRVCGITEPDRRLRCWGGGNKGGHEVDLSDLVDVAMGELHTCVLDGEGTVLCWGNNDRGQLGDGSRTYRAQPTPVDLPTVLAIEAGPDSTCALLKSGTVSCWGANTVPGDTRRLRPSSVLKLDDVEQLLGPGRALRADGSIVEWEPVDHLSSDFTAPKIVAGKSSGYTVGPGQACLAEGRGTKCRPLTTDAVAAGPGILSALGDVVEFREVFIDLRESWCARTREDHVWCWGATKDFLRIDTPTTEPRPVLGLSRVTAVSVADSHACALRDDGSVWCWSARRWGDSKQPVNPAPVEQPVEISLPSAATGLTSNGDAACAHTREGVYCWPRVGAPSRLFAPSTRLLVDSQASRVCGVSRAEIRCGSRELHSTVPSLGLPTAAVLGFAVDPRMVGQRAWAPSTSTETTVGVLLSFARCQQECAPALGRCTMS